MKTNNMFHKVVILGCSLLFGLTACDPKDEGRRRLFLELRNTRR